MTNPTPHGQVPEALRLAEQYDHGDPAAHGNAWKAAVCTELRRQHARIAELEAELEAVGAGGVQALSAAPEAVAKLRHMYQNMVNGAVRDTASAKRIAEGLLAPAIEALERATPPAEQQAAPKAAPGEPSYTSMKVAEMVLSDCGISTDFTQLLDRVAGRIDSLVEQRLDALKACLDAAPQPAPDCHHRPPCDECAALAAQGGK